MPNPDLLDELATDFLALGAGDDAVRGRLESRLCELLTRYGGAELIRLLKQLPGIVFETAAPAASGNLHELGALIGDASIRVTILEVEDLASVAIDRLPAGAPAPAPDPRHEWFYSIRESLAPDLDESDLGRLDEAYRAVYLVGLFEAQVMNGGLGQYLANTDGQYLDQTLACLDSIGARVAADVLRAAAGLRRGAESWDGLWDTRSREFDELTDRLLDAAEDLAGLTANTFA